MDQHFAFLWIIEVNGRNPYISVDRMSLFNWIDI